MVSELRFTPCKVEPWWRLSQSWALGVGIGRVMGRTLSLCRAQRTLEVLQPFTAQGGGRAEQVQGETGTLSCTTDLRPILVWLGGSQAQVSGCSLPCALLE